jgi:hypothetical protein
MCALMCFQTAPDTERFITNFTNIRALTTMYALMCCKTPLDTERLITLTPSIRALATVYALMFRQTRWLCLLKALLHSAHKYGR